jgi:hypothetical protein
MNIKLQECTKILVFGFLLIFLARPAFSQKAVINGERKEFHKITLTWEGPTADESSATFTDYRLDVTFISPDNEEFVVPGYFAADGKAGESGAKDGNKWKVHFLPLQTGEWQYETTFRKGSQIAAMASAKMGDPLAFDGDKGKFLVEKSDKSGLDFRGKGKLQYVGEHFLKFTNGEYFLKVGANSPEVLLEYADFDDTKSNRTYPQHLKDWKMGDPTWKEGKGKGIIGVVNYLSDQGMNTHYFLMMNAYGDGKKAFPWTGPDNFYNYDVSKLDQWQIVFDHMMEKGIMPQFVLSEQENQSYFEHKEGGTFANSRKIFFREMVARFGYLNALTWNIGEESGWENDTTYGKAISSTQRKDFAKYLQELVYLDDHLVVHNGPSDTDDIFSDLVGDQVYSGISYQGNFENSFYGHERIAFWRKESMNKGQRWVVSYDEPYTNPEMPDLDIWRKNAVWASFLAGGAGVEFYIGAGSDLTIEDYRQYKDYWNTLSNAHLFFIENEVPFNEMVSSDHLVSNGWCLAKPGHTYVIYLAEGGSTKLTLEEGNYSIRWYDPQAGGSLTEGSITKVSGSGTHTIGNPPSHSQKDWAVLVQRSTR